MPSTQKMPHWNTARRRYIDKTRLLPLQAHKLLAYLYMRQAPVSYTTLRIVMGIDRYDAFPLLQTLTRQGSVKRVWRGRYVIGKVSVKDAAPLIAAVHYVPGQR